MSQVVTIPCQFIGSANPKQYQHNINIQNKQEIISFIKLTNNIQATDKNNIKLKI